MGERAATDSYWFPGTDGGFKDNAAPVAFEAGDPIITVEELDGTVIMVTEDEAKLITAHLDPNDPLVSQLAEALRK